MILPAWNIRLYYALNQKKEKPRNMSKMSRMNEEKIADLERQLKTVTQNAEYWKNLYNGQIQARTADNQRHFDSVTAINNKHAETRARDLKDSNEARTRDAERFQEQIQTLTSTAQGLLVSQKHEGDKRIIEAERNAMDHAFKYLADAVAIGKSTTVQIDG